MSTKSSIIYRPASWFTISGFYGVISQHGRPFQLARTRASADNPRWKWYVKNGFPATNAMNAYGEYLSIKPGKAVGVQLGANLGPTPPFIVPIYYTAQGEVCYPIADFSHTLGSISVADSRALAQVYSALRQQKAHTEGITFLAELTDSIRTVRNVSNKLARLFDAHHDQAAKQVERYARKWGGSLAVGRDGLPVRSIDWTHQPRKRSQGLIDGIRDSWLETVFGVRPLVKDVKDLAETIARFQYDSRHTEIKGYGEEKSVIVDTTSAENIVGPINATRRVLRVRTTRVIYRAGYRISVNSASFGSAERLYSLLGFNLESFVPSLWNILPYSFVVDYFTNVSDIMSAAVTDTSHVTWVNKSIVHEIQENGALSANAGTNPPLGTSAGGDLGSYVFTKKSVIRTGPAGLDLPGIQLYFPGLKGLAWPNLLALASGGKRPHG